MASAIQPSIMEENKQLVRNFAEDVFNRHDLAAIDKYMTGAEGLKQYLGEYFAGHPDLHTTIEQIVAEGDKVFVLFNASATNKQTGKRITIKSADVYRIVNDMIVRHWDVVEASSFPNRRISELNKKIASAQSPSRSGTSAHTQAMQVLLSVLWPRFLTEIP